MNPVSFDVNTLLKGQSFASCAQDRIAIFGFMRRWVRIRTCVMVIVASSVLAGCGMPPLHRSVVVETNSSGVPVHAKGRMTSDHYTVARGDTLYSIAVRASVDYRQLARWNGISAPYVIQPGEVLRLSPPALAYTSTTPAQTPVFQPVKRAPKTSPAASANTHEQNLSSVPAPPVSTVVAVAGEPPVSTPKLSSSDQKSIPSGAMRTVDGIAWRWPANGKVLDGFDSSSPMPGIEIAGHSGGPIRAAASGIVVYAGNGLPGYGELVVIKHSKNYLSIYGHNSKRLVDEGEHVKAGQLIARMGSTGAPRNELEFQVRYKGKPVDPLHYLPKR